jgi:hypothetical protein
MSSRETNRVVVHSVTSIDAARSSRNQRSAEDSPGKKRFHVTAYHEPSSQK